MKIAYLLTPIEFGGSERVNLNFLKNADRTRLDISPVALIRPWEDENFFVGELVKEGFRVHKVPVALRPSSEGSDYMRVLRCYGLIYSFLKKNSFDLLHTHGYFADIVGIPAARMLRLPVISTCHGFISNDRNLKLYNRLDYLALRLSNRIIAVSEGIKDDLLKNGIKENRVEVIVNAVPVSADPPAFRQDRERRRAGYGIIGTDFVAGYIGRLSGEKGVKYLLEAAGSINGSGIPLKVLIIGDGPQRKELEDIAAARGLKGSVIFAGFQSGIESWLPALDVFVLPSLTEGTPMSLLEAMACGIPSVASSVGGVPRIIEPGKNGLLVKPGVPGEIKDALISLYNDSTLSNTISEGARKTIKDKYDIRNWASAIEGQYLEILKKPN